jgi:hypothetical protein
MVHPASQPHSLTGDGFAAALGVPSLHWKNMQSLLLSDYVEVYVGGGGDLSVNHSSTVQILYFLHM